VLYSPCPKEKLGHWPKSKIEAHITLYKSRLRVMVIRVLHQWLNKLQSGCVSVLTMTNKLQQMTVKMKCDWCHLLVCSSPSCKLQLLMPVIWVILRLLKKLSQKLKTKCYTHCAHAFLWDTKFLYH
jgi:hypothetical protein